MDNPVPAAVAALQAIRLPDLLDLAALARALCLESASGARRLLLRGELPIPYTRIGRRYFVRKEALLAAIEAREVRPETPPPALPPRDPELVRRIFGPRGGGR